MLHFGRGSKLRTSSSWAFTGGGWGGTAFLSELFKPRRLVAVDLSPTRVPALDAFIDRNGLHERVRPYYDVDQSDRRCLEEIIEREFGSEPLDLVIDDASHLLRETTESFNILFPRLRPGGVFVIEDWSWRHHWESVVHAALSTNEGARAELERRVLAGDTAPSKGGPLLSRLVLELVLTSAFAENVVAEVASVRRGFVVVRRGDAELDPQSFDITRSFGDLGHSLLGPREKETQSG